MSTSPDANKDNSSRSRTMTASLGHKQAQEAPKAEGPSTLSPAPADKGAKDASEARVLQDPHHPADSPAGVTSKPGTICGVCNNEVSKYKCPRCPIAYCSVACSRTHRENHPPDQPSQAALPATPAPKSPAQRKDHPFNVLDNSVELQRLFSKYPNLPARLWRIYEATLPPNGEGTSKGGLPWKLPGLSYPGKKKETWTHDVGLRRGQDALRRARTDPGEDGDGVREYCELVVHLLSRAEHSDATALVRQEIVEADAKLIERLMEAEGR